MRFVHAIPLVLALVTPAAAQPTDEEVPVKFEGDEEVVVEGEAEATFDDEEEVDVAGLDDAPPIPDHDTHTWLIGLPLLGLALLAWNVGWRKPSS